MASSETDKILELLFAFNMEKSYNENDNYSLLGVIIDKMMELTCADAGTLYIVDDNKLRFRIIRNKTLGLSIGENDDIILPSIVLNEKDINNYSAYAAISKEIVLVDDVYADGRYTGAKSYDGFTGYKTKSILLFPLINTVGNVIGVIQLLNATDKRTGRVRSFSGLINRDILQAVANISANVLSNVLYVKQLVDTLAERERIRSELAIANSIQTSVLPTVFPNRREFGIYAHIDAAKDVGGDFYDFFTMDDDRQAIVIGDVSGKGVPAALFMMVARTIIKNEAKYGLNTGDIFNRVNKQLCEENEACLFVTAFIGIYHVQTGILQYTNAGHNFPILRQANGGTEFLKDAVSRVLAVVDSTEYTSVEKSLDPGDILLLYTDGITEAFNTDDEQFSEERLFSLVATSNPDGTQSLVDTIVTEVERFSAGAERHDDITMLALKRNL